MSNSWVGIAIALISLVSAVLAGRAARSAARENSNAAIVNERTKAETEAYARARKFDVDTIERQDKEIAEIREQNRQLREKVRELIKDNDRLHEENGELRIRVTRLEKYRRNHG